MISSIRIPLSQALLVLAALSACQGEGGSGNAPGDMSDTQPFSGIAEGAVIRFSGTEPFWGGTVAGRTLIWTTPENIDGTAIAVERFAGRGGLSFSGKLSGRSFDLAVTPGACSDGMSDRIHSHVATVRLGEEILAGCAWEEGTEPVEPG